VRVDVVKIDAHRSEAIDVEIARKLMKTAFAFGVLAVLAVPLIGSGPYSPVRVSGQRNQRDEQYEKGRSLFVGEQKLAGGVTCTSCHLKKTPLDRKKLQAIRGDLQRHVQDCVQSPSRMNTLIDQKDTEALVYYLAKRYRL
jgi:hypothetical protein